MSKKFSIMTTINFDKLDREINEYVKCNGNFDPYIFMSEDTIKAIEDEFPTTEYTECLDPSLKSKYKGVEATYTGYKVFVNNDLKFGIVEIR